LAHSLSVGREEIWGVDEVSDIPFWGILKWSKVGGVHFGDLVERREGHKFIIRKEGEFRFIISEETKLKLASEARRRFP